MLIYLFAAFLFLFSNSSFDYLLLTRNTGRNASLQANGCLPENLFNLCIQVLVNSQGSD